MKTTETQEKIVKLGVDPFVDTSIILPENYRHGALGRRLVDASGRGCYEIVCYIPEWGWVDRALALKNWKQFSRLEKIHLAHVL